MMTQNNKIMEECKTVSPKVFVVLGCISLKLSKLSMQSLITRSLNVFSVVSSITISINEENISEDLTHYISVGTLNSKF